MGISEANFKRSVLALNNYAYHKRNDPIKTYNLRLIESEGGKCLECYDTHETLEDEHIDQKVLEFCQKKLHFKKGDDLNMIAFPQETLKHRIKRRNESSDLGKNLITQSDSEVTDSKPQKEATDSKKEVSDSESQTQNESDKDFAEKDNKYFSNLSFSGRINYKKIENSYKTRQPQEQENLGFLEDLIERISSFVNELWKSSFFFTLTAEYNEFMMTQENLIDSGTLNFIQKDIFLDLIKDETEPEFEDLRNGMQKMHSLEGNVIKSYLTFNNSGVPKKMWEDFQALDENNKSMWIDLSSCPGKHAMKGRIEYKGDGNYIFQMSNTGAGINKYPNLHKLDRRDGKEVYQTVVEWSFKKEDLQGEFFKKLIDATVFGTPVGETENISEDDKGKYGEGIEAISAVYSVVLEQFPKAPEDKPIDSSYWSSEQIGPSCVPYSNWSLARVVLKPEQYQKLRTEARIRYFQRNYQKIASGEDTSLSSLLHASEQVSALLTEAEAKGRSVFLFQKIQQDITDRYLEKKLINNDSLTWQALPEEITMRKAKLSKSGRSHVNVEFEELNHNDKPIKIKIKRDENQQPTGLVTLSYLLYEALVSGDDELVQTYVDKFSNFTRDHPNPFNVEIDMEIQEFNYLMYLFYHLAENFQEVDGTIAARHKQLQITNIAETLHTIYFKELIGNNDDHLKELGSDIQERMNNSLEFYKIFDTGKHLNPENNYWAGASRKLRPWEFSPLWNAYQIRNNFMVNEIKQKALKIKELPIIQNDEIPLKSFTFTKTDDENSLSVEVNTPKDTPILNEKKVILPQISNAIENLDNQDTINLASLEGKAYLVYYYFCTGQNDKLSMAISSLNSTISKTQIVDPKQVDLLIWIAKKLKNSSDNLRTLDKSPESLALQESMQLISLTLFNFIGKKSRDLTNEQSSEIEINTNNLLEWIPFYNNINAKDYVNSSIKNIHDLSKNSYDRTKFY